MAPPEDTAATLPPTSDPEEVRRRLAMPLADAMRTQRAVRRVLPDPVDDVVLQPLFELAVQAPTGSNGQNWEFVVVRDREVKTALQSQYRRAWSLYGGLGRRAAGRDAQADRILKSVE